jgi:hypothetical protein
VLQLIGAFVRGAPPPVRSDLSELRRLRRQVHAQHVQLMAQTQRASGAEEALAMLRRSVGAAERRQADGARRELEAVRLCAEQTLAAERVRVAAEAAELETQLAEARATLKPERRQAKEAATAAATQAQLARIRVEKECAAQLGSLHDEHRRQQQCQRQELAAERVAINTANVELDGTIALLEDQLDRLSGYRVGGLLSQVEEQQGEIRALSARRTKNNRTIGDANLADRRAKQWRERAESAEAQLKQYTAQNLDDDAEAHAAQVAELQQTAAGLTARVQQAEAQCAKAVAQAERARLIAEPPKEKFFAHGSYTVAVDALGLELTASCGVSPNACPRIFMLFASFFGITYHHPLARPRRAQEGRRLRGAEALLHSVAYALQGARRYWWRDPQHSGRRVDGRRSRRQLLLCGRRR